MDRTFYAQGRQGRVVAIDVTTHDKGAVASAELDHITRAQLLKALGKECPDYDWTAGAHGDKHFGYWVAYGRIL